MRIDLRLFDFAQGIITIPRINIQAAVQTDCQTGANLPGKGVFIPMRLWIVNPNAVMLQLQLAHTDTAADIGANPIIRHKVQISVKHIRF